MKNVHLIATDKPSRLHSYCNNLTYLRLSKEHLYWKEALNIYITDNSEIKEGDWCISLCDDESYGEIYQCKDVKLVDEDDKKVILTTNVDLIKDGIQSIDDEFLEWFVKNPSCEEVEVQKFYGFAENYLIIIPKEEPDYTALLQPVGTNIIDDWLEKNGNPEIAKQVELEAEELSKQETLEEVAEKLKGKELFKESNDRARKILSEIKSLPIQETLEDKLKSLVEEWQERQNKYQDIAQTAKDEHTDRKFTYKAMATRDCWKELLKLIEDEK